MFLRKVSVGLEVLPQHLCADWEAWFCSSNKYVRDVTNHGRVHHEVVRWVRFCGVTIEVVEAI